MDVRTLEWLELLVRVLFVMAGIVVALSVIGAVAIGTSDSSIPGLDTLQRENRGVIAVAALGGGLVGAGALAGLGALLKLKLVEYRERRDGAGWPPPPKP